MIADYQNKFIKIGANKDVIEVVLKCYNLSKNQTDDILDEIRYIPQNDQIKSVWNYFVENVKYSVDPGDNQYIKTPARLIADGVGDCKSFSIFFASVLHCLHIPFCFRFVNFNGGKQYSHVYVVANPGSYNEIILDAVEKDKAGNPRYNFARSFKTKMDVYE